MNHSKIISDIQSVLSDDLLKPSYRKLQNRHVTTGHCYAASEALYHLTGGRDIWHSCVGKDENGGTHWWLEHKKSGYILDVTSEQFTCFGKEPPYSNSKKCAFLTSGPSNRAKEIIKRLSDKNINFDSFIF